VCRSSLDSAADQFDVAGLMDQGRLRDSGLAACRALLDAMDPGAESIGLVSGFRVRVVCLVWY